LDYDNVMNKQREVIYSLRRSILEGENLRDVILDAVLMTSDDVVDSHYAIEQKEEAFDHLAADVKSKFGANIDALKEDWSTLNSQHIKEELEGVLVQAYEIKE